MLGGVRHKRGTRVRFLPPLGRGAPLRLMVPAGPGGGFDLDMDGKVYVGSHRKQRQR